MKPTAKTVVLTVAIAALFPVGYVVGQGIGAPDLTPAQEVLLAAQTQVQYKGDPEDYVRLVRLYEKAPDDAAVIRQSARMALVAARKNGALDAVALQVAQAMQNQKLIEQNAEIIRLLKERR